MKNKNFRFGALFAMFIILVCACQKQDAPEPLKSANGNALKATSTLVPLFNGINLDGWSQKPANSWVVKNAVLTSTGANRGFIYTVPTATSAGQWGFYRVIFKMRHVSGNHQACVLVFNISPTLDAMGGVQFQVPNGSSWDYRPGKNNSGSAYFTRPHKTSYVTSEWSQVEILVNAAAGTARMAVAQPVDALAVENLDFKDAPSTIPSISPFAIQIHNGGLFDEYKDIMIEVNPTVNDLITTKPIINDVPVAPTSLSATAVSQSQINLTWADNATNETGYNVEISADGVNWGPPISLPVNSTSYSQTGLAAGTKMFYRVYAYNSVGNSAYSNIASATTLGVTTNEYVWLEAESGTITAPMVVLSDTSASSGKYIMAPAGTNSTAAAPATGYSTLSCTINGGSYKLWGRTIATTTGMNSFYIRVDNGAWVTWNDNAAVSTTWKWNTLASLSIASGTHSLVIAYREGGTKLDKLLLTNDAAFVPTGKGGGVIVPPSTEHFYLEAEAGVITAPMAILSDAAASGGKYIMAPVGTNSTAAAPANGSSKISFNAIGGSYRLLFRTIMATTATNSFWYRIDNGAWVSWNVDANVSTAWKWNSVATVNLSAGPHSITVTYREGGTKLDRIVFASDLVTVFE
jgi:hypothetical protein